MSKYDEDLKKACEILNNTELDELVQVAVEAMDDAATDIGMEASQEWHAKITLESALMRIAEKVAKRPHLTIPKSIADELEKYDFELTSKGLMYSNMGGTLVEFSRVTYDEIPQLIVQTIAGNYRIVFAYLAGKALGVDLVEVIE
ncbi:hypothetical protein LMG9449_0329 [Lactococcus lactis subsp. lactis]|uniref:Phage protein n=1 Tax=Lactococcus lactis subsp. lactis TaxID=1360 RepID=A0A0V8E8V5_LACLL|nr:hypothetical protein [Lactococcus lactis]KSU22230.1 hypothetical protein LMG9449_0329 [Lactococcus lactis subsp. lactis]